MRDQLLLSALIVVNIALELVVDRRKRTRPMMVSKLRLGVRQDRNRAFAAAIIGFLAALGALVIIVVADEESPFLVIYGIVLASFALLRFSIKNLFAKGR